MCLKRQKKSTKIQLQTAGTLVASFQNKLQIFRCNSFAIFIMLSLKGYSERGLVVGFGIFPFFFFLWQYQISPGKGPTADQDPAAVNFISCKPPQCWGFPQARPSHYSHWHSQEDTRPPKCDACSSGLAGMSASALQHHQLGQKLSW